MFCREITIESKQFSQLLKLKFNSYMSRQNYQGYRCESGIVIFASGVKWNYAYSPFKYCISGCTCLDLVHTAAVLVVLHCHKTVNGVQDRTLALFCYMHRYMKTILAWEPSSVWKQSFPNISILLRTFRPS